MARIARDYGYTLLNCESWRMGLAANQIPRRLPATVIGQASRSQAVVRVASGGDPPETCPEGANVS